MDFQVRLATMESVDAFLASVEGELDLATAAEAREASEVAARVRSPLVLDLSECSFIDSSGLRAVLHAYWAMAAVNRAMIIVSANPQVRQMLALTGFDVHIRVFHAQAQALAWLKREEAAAPLSSPEPYPALHTNGRRAPAASLLP